MGVSQYSVNDCDQGAWRLPNANGGGALPLLWLVGGRPDSPSAMRGTGWYQMTPQGFDPTVRMDWFPGRSAEVFGAPGSGYAGLSVNPQGYVVLPDDGSVEAFRTPAGNVGFKPRAAVVQGFGGVQVGPSNGGGGGVANNNGGSGMGYSTSGNGNGNGSGNGDTDALLASIIAAQQQQSALAPLFSDAATAMAAAAAAAAAGTAVLQFGQAVIAAFQGSSAPAGSSSSLGAILQAMLGATGMQTIVTATVTLNGIAENPASQAALNTAWVTWKTSVSSALAGIQGTSLLASLVSGGANKTGVLVGFMMAQTATTAVQSAFATATGATLADLQADYIRVSAGVQAYMAALVNNSIVAALAA